MLMRAEKDFITNSRATMLLRVALVNGDFQKSPAINQRDAITFRAGGVIGG